VTVGSDTDGVTRVSVLVVDDDAEFRALAVRVMRLHGFEVVGEAADAASAVAAAMSLSPGAVLLDVNLPDHDGFWVAEALTDAGVGSRIVLTSSAMTHVPSDTLERVGAVAFVPKIDLATADLASLLN
jgi:CheY-like chemotaxis protein